METLAQGLTSPVRLVSPPDDDRRLVVDRVGVIYMLDGDGQLLEEPVLDIRDRLVDLRPSFDERGLLGLAFHPDFSDNGRYFVYYSAPLRSGAPAGWDHTSILSEFQVDPPGSKAQPERMSTRRDSERVLLRIDQPQFNHNGGSINFGPDGFLYIALGDGGGAHDVGLGHPPEGNGQDISTLLGSILRIDVDGERGEYTIPPGNPFVDKESGREEIYSFGWRNPWRMSFDKTTGELWVATNGQSLWEAVYQASEPGNYGWNILEGSHCFDPQNPGTTPPKDECEAVGARGRELEMPVIEYPHPQNKGDHSVAGVSVIGGYVYHGGAIEGLEGRYVFGDWSGESGRGGQLFVANPPDPDSPEESWKIEKLHSLNQYLLGFGRDSDGELYVLTTETTGPTGDTGAVHKITPAQ